MALFLEKGLLDPDFARKLLEWRHSGFSIESGTRIYDKEARQGLCQYIVRAPLAMQKLTWNENMDTVTGKSSPMGYFQGKEVHFSCLDFIAQLTLHIPPPGRHLLHYYGLYSSRSRGTWKNRPGLRLRAPQRWYGLSADQKRPHDRTPRSGDWAGGTAKRLGLPAGQGV